MDLDELVVVERAEVARMTNGRHHEMAGGVRELVQQHEGLRPAMDDQLLLVIAIERAAEHAAGILVGGLDVLEAPRRPESFHALLQLVRRLERDGALGPRADGRQPRERREHRGDEEQRGCEEDRLHLRSQRLTLHFGCVVGIPPRLTPAG